MKSRCFSPVVRFAAGLCLLAVLSACSLLHRHPKDTDSTAKTRHPATASGLELELKFSPDPVKLGEVREISVNITLRNVSNRTATLKFPTTQILEIALRDVGTDTIVSKWSADRTFSDDRRIIPVNKGEHLEYTEPITTRELKAGRAYNLEVSFLGYEKELFVKKAIIPQP